jgi:hypothetical protein
MLMIAALAGAGLAPQKAQEDQKAPDKKAPAEKPKAPALTTAELEKMIDEDYFFLDVRSAKEIEELGTVKKYVHIPIEELEARLKEIPKGRTVVTL